MWTSLKVVGIFDERSDVILAGNSFLLCLAFAFGSASPRFSGPLLFLAGGKDKLVPHTASTRFLDALRQQNGPLFELFVDEKAGHVFSKPMLERAVEFCWKNVGGAGAGGAKL